MYNAVGSQLLIHASGVIHGHRRFKRSSARNAFAGSGVAFWQAIPVAQDA
jgi:hypothetical protein